ncbi:MAG: aminopeptidase N [Gammaproteobacteria bacterium]|jgi:aminopeptidase N|nr:aminopeptidase N [Gammaproteobacteria bacterium]MBT3858685.1 aminopeptidase N [Gammaproteobacteria bacterium]MBT3986037.1 aminopeptidase N [Gammaproteobacteria bacterium]MBT4255164.1 aminopeptidase N [Gammaproteobacteria bacterium]MBT4582399.1 aminopeptidase N [Gammaproteobacteria bacterium]
MKNAQARTTYLKDYQPSDFLIETTDLSFDLYEDHAKVVSKLLIKRNSLRQESSVDTLVLNGQLMVLEGLLIDGKELSDQDYLLDDETLSIPNISSFTENGGAEFRLQCHTRIEPQNNTALEGLYKSQKMFCTQCEAEGFRRITYYLDRPDVMSKFTTTISADRKKYPVLLSNGNKFDGGEVEGDSSRHWVKWEDPFKKPCYLFALVAGDLVSLDDSFISSSGRDIKLQIFVEEKDIDKCDHAMLSLKNSMKWDEDVYGREYDLDIFMIVAVDDFNMGAMENKGLNVFNTSCVLANPKTTTDLSFQRVEAVVAHEYFHNWSGNRVTCRDWFQLSLKEGFTVFRDSEFSADMGSRTVKRVEDVSFLQTIQFAEDAGPMSHSVRPDSYMEISNFYTVTIYEKGAEVVRMINLLVGAEGFRKGSDLYFDRHDGQAVTTEDFVKAMEDANDVELTQFRNWYSQAGTPELTVSGEYDESAKQYTLNISQSCPDTPGQSNKAAFHIPFRLGLISPDGNEYSLRLSGEDESLASSDRVLDVKKGTEQFVFEGVDAEPVPSLLRSFSAPVKLHYEYTREQLFFLMVHDSDGFNRWNSSQLLAIDIMDQLQQDLADGVELDIPSILIDAYSGVLESALNEPDIDKAMVAHLLSLPVEGFLIERAECADVDRIHRVREFLANALADRLRESFSKIYLANQSEEEFSADASSVARRTLKNLALSYLVRTADDDWLQSCKVQFESATNMTDQLSALRSLTGSGSETASLLKGDALDDFYRQWKHEPLVVDQWFAMQATNQLPGSLDRVNALLTHEDFNIRNPNKVRSLIGAFCGQNHIGFHDSSGSGYKFLADKVLELDKLNPQIAARLLTPLTRWKNFDEKRTAMMIAELNRIKADTSLSKDVFEVVEKSTKV